MNILLTTLPTKGLTLGNPGFDSIEIRPLTYRQLVNYTSRDFTNGLDKELADIEGLMMDIQNWHRLSAYDLSFLIFMRKYISAMQQSGDFYVTADGKRYIVRMDQIHFKDINEELLKMKSVELNEKVYGFHIPTIKEYYDALKYVSQMVYSSEPWLNQYDVMIFAALGLNGMNAGEIISSYANASGDDVITIKYIDRILNNTVNDVTVKVPGEGGDETAINLNKIITDTFRFILDNRTLNQTKIKFSSKIRPEYR